MLSSKVSGSMQHGQCPPFIRPYLHTAYFPAVDIIQFSQLLISFRKGRADFEQGSWSSPLGIYYLFVLQSCPVSRNSHSVIFCAIYYVSISEFVLSRLVRSLLNNEKKVSGLRKLDQEDQDLEMVEPWRGIMRPWCLCCAGPLQSQQQQLPGCCSDAELMAGHLTVTHRLMQ